MAAQPAPLTLLVANSHFQRSKRLPPTYHFREESQQGGTILQMRAAAKLQILHFFRFVTEDVLHSRTDKGVVPAAIHHKDQIRETVDQAAREFLLLVQAAFHLPALGNVHQRPVIANDTPVSVAHGAGSIETDQRPSVLARKRNLPPLDHRLAIHFFAQRTTLLFIRKQIGEAPRKQFFLGFISKHARQRRIDVDEPVVRGNDVNSFLQRFKQLGKARFALTQRGDIARQDRDAMHLIAAKHSVRHAVEIVSGIASLQSRRNDARPDSALEKTRHRSLCNLTAFPGPFFDKFTQIEADDLGKGGAHEVGEAAICCANLSVERDGEQDVVERIDQVAITLLGTRDDFK